MYTGTVESIGGYILGNSVAVKAVQKLIIGEAGTAVEFFGKDLSQFCIPVAKQCKMYK